MKKKFFEFFFNDRANIFIVLYRVFNALSEYILNIDFELTEARSMLMIMHMHFFKEKHVFLKISYLSQFKSFFFN